MSTQVEWALEELAAAGVTLVMEHRENLVHDAADGQYLQLLDVRSDEGAMTLTRFDLGVPTNRGAFATAPGTVGREGTAVIAQDAVGLLYGVLELRDRIRNGEDPAVLLSNPHARLESPATRVRAVGRSFVSAAHDKDWYRSPEFWQSYLSMLSFNRFSQINLAMGIAYDFPIHITDAYLLFAYPYLLDVPNYKVQATNVSPEERDENLVMLKFASSEATRRGLDFQLGLWTHSYANAESPDVNHVITGLNEENHAAYSRDALAMLLSQCPDISGITLRVHGESGIPEGDPSFWGALFGAVAEVRSPGTFTIDLHAKGLTPEIIDRALASGARVVVSAKLAAEHMGLPYQQASIRELDRRGRQVIASDGDSLRRTAHGLMGLSLFSRSSTRYSYGDFLRLDRGYEVIYRIWPGTQKVLSWEDALFASAYASAGRFCNSSGLEVMEPLSFRGRRGSGLGGDLPRSGYRNPQPLGMADDWEKYIRTYRVWGEALFGDCSFRSPRMVETSDGATDRSAVSSAVDRALALAGRVLPLVTSAHLPSAANVHYWPEVYTIAPITKDGEDGIYNIFRGDSARPVRFGTISPLDPVIFCSCEDFAAEWVSGFPSGRYSPLDVAEWLEELALQIQAEAAKARAAVIEDAVVKLRLADADALANLAMFFARLFVCGVGYELYLAADDAVYLDGAIEALDDAIGLWDAMCRPLTALYVGDLAFGEVAEGRGSWADRLEGLNREQNALRLARDAAQSDGAPCESGERQQATWTTIPGAGRLPSTIRRRLPRPQGTLSAKRADARSGGLDVLLTLEYGAAGPVDQVAVARLYYRHVNQFETYEVLVMESLSQEKFQAVIPASYLVAPYPVQFFCEVEASDRRKARLPGLGADLTCVPYEVWMP